MKTGNDWTKPKTTAVVLAAGAGERSRALLKAELSDSTVAQQALSTLRKVVNPEDIIVVVAPGDDEMRNLLGDDLTYVIQDEPLGTGHAVTAARYAIPEGTEQLLVTYADTPLLSASSLRGLLNRHALMDGDFSLLTAVVDQPLPYGRVERGADSRVVAIVEPEDLDEDEAEIREINVGSYVASPKALLREIDDLAEDDEYRSGAPVHR